MRLILGSSSRWRADVLRATGAAFDVIAPDIDEKAIRHRDPYQLTMRIALSKARKVAATIGDKQALIICADQVCVFDGVIREKPLDSSQARYFLKSYAGRSVTTVTAVVVMDAGTLDVSKDWDPATVHFGSIPDAAIEAAIARGDVMHSCGAFTLEDPDIGPCVVRIEGTKDSVDGLPLDLTRSLLAELGYKLP